MNTRASLAYGKAVIPGGETKARLTELTNLARIERSTSLSQERNSPIPIPIPSEKLVTALKLYRIYQIAERSSGHQEQTGTMRGSKKSLPQSSIKTRSPSGHEAKVRGGFRVRLRLSPAKQAKTALRRYLGACKSCRDRNVPCSLEHYDLDSFKSLDNNIARSSYLSPLLESPTMSPLQAKARTMFRNTIVEENQSFSATIERSNVGRTGLELGRKHFDIKSTISRDKTQGEAAFNTSLLAGFGRKMA